MRCSSRPVGVGVSLTRGLPCFAFQRPGLRKQQYENELFDEFKKSPQNPFNQLNVSYNAFKEERVDALNKNKESIARRLADH